MTRAPKSLTLGDLLVVDPSATQVSEQEWVGLIRGIAAGELGALRSVYERSHRLVFTLILRFTKDRATAEELTIDVYHDIWRCAASYDPAKEMALEWILGHVRALVARREAST